MSAMDVCWCTQQLHGADDELQGHLCQHRFNNPRFAPTQNFIKPKTDIENKDNSL